MFISGCVRPGRDFQHFPLPHSSLSIPKMTLKRETPAHAQHTVNTTKKKKNLVSLLTLERVKRRWQKAVQVVITVQRVAGIAEALRHPDHAKTFIDITEEEYSRYRQTVMGTAFSSGLTLKETMLSHHVCRILSTPPVHRSDEDIRQVVNGLRFIREFTAYPPHVQTQLARIGWYCKVQPNRIIIRQGQPPDACYFILGGQALVKKMKRDSTARVETILHQGACFGELALLYNSRRARTVASRTTVHMLWVLGEDFLDIFRGPRTVHNTIPDHIKYLGKLDLMKGWPMSELYDNPSYCRTLYFRNDTVIVRDSTDSQWLYIVRSGTCEVAMLVPQMKLNERDFYRALRQMRRLSETNELQDPCFDWNRNVGLDTRVSSCTSARHASGRRGSGQLGEVSPDREPTESQPRSYFAEGSLPQINFHGTKEQPLFSNPNVIPPSFIQTAVHQCPTVASPSNDSLLSLPPIATQSFVKKPLPRFLTGWPPKRTKRILRRWHKVVSMRLQTHGHSRNMDQNRNSTLSSNEDPNLSPYLAPPTHSPKSRCPVIDTPSTPPADFKLQSIAEERLSSWNIYASNVNRKHSTPISRELVKPSPAKTRSRSLCPNRRTPVSVKNPLPLISFSPPTVPPSSPVLTNDPDALSDATTSMSRGQAIRKPSKTPTKSSFSSSIDFKPTKFMYVSLQELHEGDVFGLDQMPLPLYLGAPVISPSTCLISRGAECVLMHKSFYAEHAPDLLRAQLASNSFEYPHPELVAHYLHQAQFNRLVLKDLLHRMVPKEWICSSDDEK